MIIIDAMLPGDWPAVREIYQQGIGTGSATFAPAPPASWEEWQRARLNACSLVARANAQVVGWAALSPVSSRKVYAGVAEVSLYVAEGWRGKGVGSLILAELIRVSEANGIWTLQAGILPENQASANLHLKHGFRLVGRREKLGKMEFGPFAGQWRDVLLLERRSKTIGAS
jgi:L-amino acid N-acyltransferase YncA